MLLNCLNWFVIHVAGPSEEDKILQGTNGRQSIILLDGFLSRFKVQNVCMCVRACACVRMCVCVCVLLVDQAS